MINFDKINLEKVIEIDYGKFEIQDKTFIKNMLYIFNKFEKNNNCKLISIFKNYIEFEFKNYKFNINFDNGSNFFVKFEEENFEILVNNYKLLEIIENDNKLITFLNNLKEIKKRDLYFENIDYVNGNFEADIKYFQNIYISLFNNKIFIEQDIYNKQIENINDAIKLIENYIEIDFDYCEIEEKYDFYGDNDYFGEDFQNTINYNKYCYFIQYFNKYKLQLYFITNNFNIIDFINNKPILKLKKIFYKDKKLLKKFIKDFKIDEEIEFEEEY